MKTAIILHGMPTKDEYLDPKGPAQSNMHWLPWLQGQLIIRGILAQTPELPEAYAPDYEKWKNVFEQFNINEETILVGHSAGAGFLVRWLSENKINIGKLALVGPYINPKDQEATAGFFDFIIDSSLVERTKGLIIFYSTDDGKEVVDTVSQLKVNLKGSLFEEFSDRGHFTVADMGTDEFPELLDYLLK